jgi:hypothetical protein
MLTVYYNVYNATPKKSDTPIYKMKDYNINRLESVGINMITLEVQDTFFVSKIDTKLEDFNFESLYINNFSESYLNSEVNYSFEKTNCKKLDIIENNSIKFGCFCLNYTDPEEIYILFDKINKKYLLENLQSKFYIENLNDLLNNKNKIDPNRSEVKELFYKVLAYYEDNKDFILPFIIENLDNWWMRELLFTNFNYTNLNTIQTLVECKKEEIKMYNLIISTMFKNSDLIIDDIVKFVIKEYI